MTDPETTYDSLISTEDLTTFSTLEALFRIGQLTDLSSNLKRPQGLRHAIEWGEEVRLRELSGGELALSHYFAATGWTNLRELLRTGTAQVWDWEQEELEKEILHFRSALREDGLRKLSPHYVNGTLSNLGNSMSYAGRFIEAIEYWDNPSQHKPLPPEAVGSRGANLYKYALTLYDNTHEKILLKYAYADLMASLNSPDLHATARSNIEWFRQEIESALPQEYLSANIDLHAPSLGRSKAERQYRQWCLDNRLFLNPLNEISTRALAAGDILTTPDMLLRVEEGPSFPGYFNQLKQEFVSARYLLYEGMTSDRAHFSDRRVILFNTLDHPVYSLAVEKVKAAYRIVYSLFDKIAFLLNRYLDLKVPEKQIYFRTFWYQKQKRENGPKPTFREIKNWPLRGLFWLSKDLQEDRPGFREAIEPDAQEISSIRNHLEHKYLKLHQEALSTDGESVLQFPADALSHSVNRGDFERKALKLTKMARTALMQLSLAIHREEQRRAQDDEIETEVPGFALGIWDDRLKI